MAETEPLADGTLKFVIHECGCPDKQFAADMLQRYLVEWLAEIQQYKDDRGEWARTIREIRVTTGDD